MNIFFVHKDAETAAHHLCDKHINKMLVESVQMLSTCHHLIGSGNDQMYKPAFQNHPCSIWVRKTAQNYFWLFRHAWQIAIEFENRFGKIHASKDVLLRLPEPDLPLRGLTNPAQAMPDQYKHFDPVHAYRNYYRHEKQAFAKWEKGTPAPYWWSIPF